MREKKSKTRIRRKNVGIKRLVVFIAIVITVIFLMFKIVPSAARYAYTSIRTFYLSTKEFYFNSTKMSTSTGGATFVATNWPGGKYPVKVYLTTIKNADKYTKTNVDYDFGVSYEVYKKDGTLTHDYDSIIAVSVDATPKMESGAQVVIDDYEYYTGTIISKEVDSTYNNQDAITINVSGATGSLETDDYIEIKMIAKSTSPYIQTLYGTIRITFGKLALNYEIDDEANKIYSTAIVSNTLMDAQRIKLVFDANHVSFDNTEEYELKQIISSPTLPSVVTSGMNGEVSSDTNTYNYLTEVTFDLSGQDSKEFRFYKKDVSKNYEFPGETEIPEIKAYSYDSLTSTWEPIGFAETT